ncbi:uncharacterized protein LOC131840974 [Achroia grisella]|uniref:uncharacterized protein LOC131840974 n=1 Tax=Achroia grisella TaxID=688607 RepID=UPI0027D33DA2|nr:uncharacterized protein LOC131840974 [Achroia grisella]
MNGNMAQQASSVAVPYAALTRHVTSRLNMAAIPVLPPLPTGSVSCCAHSLSDVKHVGVGCEWFAVRRRGAAAHPRVAANGSSSAARRVVVLRALTSPLDNGRCHPSPFSSTVASRLDSSSVSTQLARVASA